MLYRQCRFRRGHERTVAWIEARGAKPDAWVELTTLDDKGPWQVEAVFAASLKSVALETLQRMSRTFVSDFVRNIV